MKRPRVFLLDAYGLIYRAFYAIRALTNSKGQPTNAVFGFCNILRKLLTDLKPTHLAVCFDVGKKTRRADKYPAYKAHRQAMPDDLITQIAVIRKIIEAYRIPIVELEGHEADDVMAALARRFREDADIVLVTEDKDLGQLVGQGVSLYSARQEKVLGPGDIKAKFGVSPAQIVDYIAIAGDSSDNIPGVKGIGEVGARKLLEEFGSLENIYRHLDDVKAVKLREKLADSRDDAFLSRELASLQDGIDVPFSLDDLKVQEPDTATLKKLFEDLEFRKFAAELNVPAARQSSQTLLPAMAAFQRRARLSARDGEIEIVYDLKALLKEGAGGLRGKVFDVYLAGYLLGGGQKFDINSLCWTYLKQAPGDDCLKELYLPLANALREQELEQLYQEVELPLARVLDTVERNGVKIDEEFLASLAKEGEAKLGQLKDELFRAAGSEFNINSPKQLSDVLFERLKLPVIKKTKTGRSTDEEVLTRLAQQHPLPALILEYRQIAKLKSTYIDSLPLLIDRGDSRVHATFEQTGAETGRLSSHDPNLQNIPVRTPLGRKIRQAFIAFDGHSLLLSADYSQIELRILAHLSNDENLKRAFAQSQDIHRFTASLMFDTAVKDVDEQMRYAAKRINFGILYGMSAFGLSKDLGVPLKQAQEFIDRYFQRYPSVRAYLEGEVRKARALGYSRTMFNRRRYLPDINNRNQALRQFAERQAINAPIQGSAADLIKKAMVDIDRAVRQARLRSLMIMTVHDELVFNVPQGEMKEMTDLVRQCMEGALELSVPVIVTQKTGRDWLNMSAVLEQ